MLVIFDEAHRALGNYSYAKIIRKLSKYNFGFRILALSATPGNNLEQIQEVLKNLRIKKLEMKDEQDPDVRKYIKQRLITPVKID